MASNINTKSAKTIWRNIAVAVFAVCFALIGLGVTVLPTKATDDRGYVVGEIYQNHTNIQHLYDLITGKNNATYADVVAAAENTTNSADMREYNNDNDIKVTFGGMEWYAVYLSKTNEDNPRPILTLWLAEPFTVARWGYASNATGVYNYPNDMYSTSYVRTKILNNAGGYSTDDGRTLNNSVTPDINHPLARFSVPTADGALTDLIVKPALVEWQRGGQIGNNYYDGPRLGYNGFNMKNENWGEEPTTGWCTIIDAGSKADPYSNDYSNIAEYGAWANDYLWLPSVTEGVEIWQNFANESNGVPFYEYYMDALYWIRSGTYSYHAFAGFTATYAGTNGAVRGSSVNYERGIRPALHIDLSNVNLVASLANVPTDDITVKYDGNDHQLLTETTQPAWYNPEMQITYTKDGRTETTVRDAGEYTVTVALGDETKTFTITVTPKAVTVDGTTIAPQQAAYAYNQKTEVPLNTDAIKVTGLIDGDTVGISYRGLMDDKNAGKDKPVTVTVTLTGDSAKNYVLTEAQFTTKVTINPRTIAINNIKAKDKEYDGTDDAILDFSEITYNPIIFVGDDVTVLVKGKYSQKNVSEESLIVTLDYALGLAGADAGNYQIDEEKNNQLVATASIRPRAITVTIKDQVVKVGDTKDLTFSITSGSLAGNDKADTVFTLDLRDGTERDGLPVGEYQIVGTKVGNPNYEVEFANYGIYRVLSEEDWNALQTKEEPKDNNFWLIIIIVIAVAAFIGALVGIGLVIRSHDKSRDNKPRKERQK